MRDFAQIPPNTFSFIQKKAGILVREFDPTKPTIENSKIIGATTGGYQFSAVPAMLDMGDDIDNCPKGMVEDMYVYPVGDHFEMIAEDAGGAYTGIPKAGAHFVSEDAVHWVPSEPCLAYDYDILYDDGSREELQRRERPSLFSDKTGTYLFTTAKIGGEDRLTGGETWNMVQKISGNN